MIMINRLGVTGHVRIMLGIQHMWSSRRRQFHSHRKPPQPQRTTARRLRSHGQYSIPLFLPLPPFPSPILNLSFLFHSPVRSNGQNRLQQRLQRRPNDQRLQIPNPIRRTRGRIFIPLHRPQRPMQFPIR